MRAVLFDVDGTLISSGGAGAASWRMAFDDLYGVPADIDKYADEGMTEPEVASITFRNVLGRDPSKDELARLMSTRMHHLRARPWRTRRAFRVLPGVRATLDRLAAAGYLLGVTTGGMEEAARIKLARANLDHYFSFGGYGSDSATGPSSRAWRSSARARCSASRSTRGRSWSWATRPMTSRPRTAPAPSRWASRPAASTRIALRDAGADHVLRSLEERAPALRRREVAP